MTDLPSPSGSTVAEAEAFLAAHPEIEAFDIVLHDANGIGRGKIIRRHELLSFYKGGRHLPISILGLDICGEDVHETGLIWDQGDGDLRAWPIPGTLVPLHATTPPRGEVFMSMYDLDGNAMSSDPRHALQRQVDALAAEGLYPSGAFELEFFLLDNERGPDGKVRPARDVLDGRASHKTEVYSVDHLHGMLPLFSDIYAGAAKAGIKAETMISEYAPGQYELTLHYRADVMQAADDLMRLKRIVRMQARQHGVTACFMAKPVESYAGSGMHFHVSMMDASGKNVFVEATEGQWNDTILHALGGLRATMGESMLVFAPHANSWRRFASQSYAPVSPTWGVNNRSVALRIPAGDIKARRIEHRVAGGDVNPYLMLAAILGAALDGIENQMEPPSPIVGNAYAVEGLDEIPTSWEAAIDALEQSAIVPRFIHPELIKNLVSTKRQEHHYLGELTDTEIVELYLDTV